MSMNENTVAGKVKETVGKVESFAGEAIDDREVRSRGLEDQVHGQAQQAVGATQTAAAKVTEQAKAMAGTLADTAKDTYGRVADQAKDAYGKAADQAKDAYGKVTDQAKDAYGKVTDQAKETYGKVTDQAKDVYARVDPMVRQQPYAALGVAAVAGFIAGMLMNAGGSKVIYIKSKD
jgi:ElaB/YqjD/DUF883 family membrane-anchored ribosome-binding protein